MDRTNWVRLLDLPFVRDGRGLETRAVVFCCLANVQGGQGQHGALQFRLIESRKMAHERER